VAETTARPSVCVPVHDAQMVWSLAAAHGLGEGADQGRAELPMPSQVPDVTAISWDTHSNLVAGRPQSLD
jgi:hypothetical protein